jgi:hypothetical protein
MTAPQRKPWKTISAPLGAGVQAGVLAYQPPWCSDRAVMPGGLPSGATLCERSSLWGRSHWEAVLSVNTSRFSASPPNNGLTKSLEEAKQRFRQRYEEMKAQE